MLRPVCLLAAMLLLAGSLKPAAADVRLAGVFADHMVLQQGAAVPVWGWADAGEKISVTILDQTVSTEAGSDGRWRVNLQALKSSIVPVELKVTGKNTVTISDVLIGEVWLASGQSNMEYSLKSDQDAATELPKANYPDIRFCMVGTRPEMKPLADRKLSWTVVNPVSAQKFSAVAYYFGRDLHAALNVPVGIIEASVAGTAAEAWTDLDALQSAPALQHFVDELHDQTSATTQRSAFNAGTPTSLYNGLIAPLIPYAIKGAIWYQGESNAGQYEEYRTLFPAMIRGWRAQWGEGDFPFLFVQLPGFGKRGEPDRQNWAPMREAQTAALALPNVGMAVALDLVRARALLHPKSKVGVGHRLALIAEHQVYGQDVVDSGPTFAGMTVDGDIIHVRFGHANGGLRMGSGKFAATQSVATTGPVEFKGFAVAGEDRHFYPAQATLSPSHADDGATASLDVRSDQVKTPVAVRYGWADNPDVNIYNAAGLAAAPFRSDDWPIPVPSKTK